MGHKTVELTRLAAEPTKMKTSWVLITIIQKCNTIRTPMMMQPWLAMSICLQRYRQSLPSWGLHALTVNRRVFVSDLKTLQSIGGFIPSHPIPACCTNTLMICGVELCILIIFFRQIFKRFSRWNPYFRKVLHFFVIFVCNYGALNLRLHVVALLASVTMSWPAKTTWKLNTLGLDFLALVWQSSKSFDVNAFFLVLFSLLLILYEGLVQLTHSGSLYSTGLFLKGRE